MWVEVTVLRRRGLRLHSHEWPPTLHGNLQISQMHGPNNPFRQHVRMATVWESYGSTSQRGLGTMFDPVILMTPGDGFLLRGIELDTQQGRMHEHQQVWLCRPTHEGAQPLPPFQATVSTD